MELSKEVLDGWKMLHAEELPSLKEDSFRALCEWVAGGILLRDQDEVTGSSVQYGGYQG